MYKEHSNITTSHEWRYASEWLTSPNQVCNLPAFSWGSFMSVCVFHISGSSCLHKIGITSMFRMLYTIAGSKPHHWFPQGRSCVAMMLYTVSPLTAKFLPTTMGVELSRQGVSQQLVSSLNRPGICCSSGAAMRHIDSICTSAEDLDRWRTCLEVIEEDGDDGNGDSMVCVWVHMYGCIYVGMHDSVNRS